MFPVVHPFLTVGKKSVGYFPTPCMIQQKRREGDRMQEREIVALLRERDEQGLHALLVHYGPLMRYVIAPILRDPQEREECLSEVTMRVWEKIGTFQEERGSWNGWLTTLTRHAALNHARRLSRHGGAEALSEDTSSPELTPEEALLRQERQAALQTALGQLSTGERLLFYRKYYYLQSTAQIASELGLTERAVEGRLYRLKRQLRKLLGGDERA